MTPKDGKGDNVKVVRSQAEIDELLNRCAAQEDEGGSIYPGMTFEQGITITVRWLEDASEPHPLDE